MCHGQPGAEGPPGPPTLETLIREWVKEDPILRDHLFFTEYNEGTYIETRCDWSRKVNQHRYPITGGRPGNVHSGYSLALFPSEGSHDKRIMIFYHGQGVGDEKAAKVRGYLRREDPHFIEKLRESIILEHDALFDITEYRIKWEFGETLSYREAADRQSWWQDGVDL